MTKEMKKACIAAGLFILLIVLLKLCDVAAIGPAGTQIGLSSLNGAWRDAIGESGFWYVVSTVFGTLSFVVAAFFALLCVLQLVKGKSIKAVDRELKYLMLLYLATLVVYLLFERIIINYRPIIEDGAQYPEASFPSSHTMMAVVILGSALLLVQRYFRQKRLRDILRIVLALMLALIVAGRLLSGVHWFTDIIGGILAGVALLSVYEAMVARKRRHGQ